MNSSDEKLLRLVADLRAAVIGSELNRNRGEPRKPAAPARRRKAA